MQFFAEMFVPVRRRHAAFLPVVPARVGLQCSPHLLGGKAVVFAEVSKRASQIDGDDHSTYIENDRLGSFEDWAAKNRHGYLRSDGVAATTSEVFTFPANLARNTLMTGGSKDTKMTAAMT